jgi:hypothetical protein
MAEVEDLDVRQEAAQHTLELAKAKRVHIAVSVGRCAGRTGGA